MIDVQKLQKKSKTDIIKTLLDEASRMDERRRQQIKNQLATINRLMTGTSVAEELSFLHEELAKAQMALAEREGETRSMYDLGVSKEV